MDEGWMRVGWAESAVGVGGRRATTGDGGRRRRVRPACARVSRKQHSPLLLTPLREKTWTRRSKEHVERTDFCSGDHATSYRRLACPPPPRAMAPPNTEPAEAGGAVVWFF